MEFVLTWQSPCAVWKLKGVTVLREGMPQCLNKIFRTYSEWYVSNRLANSVYIPMWPTRHANPYQVSPIYRLRYANDRILNIVFYLGACAVEKNEICIPLVGGGESCADRKLTVL